MAESLQEHAHLSLVPELFTPEVHNPSLSLILPAYNEGTRQEGNTEMGYAFKSAISRYSDFFEKEFPSDWELVVVDDGSIDLADPGSTARIAHGLGARVISYPDGNNKGRGGALKVGFTQTTGNVRIYTDADGSYTPETIYDLHAEVATNDHDIAVAYRAESEKQFDCLVRKYGHSIIHRICEHPLMAPTGVFDPQAGAKAFSAEAADHIWTNVTTNGWAADREALVLAREYGYSIAQVAAAIEAHEGSSVAIVKDSLKMIRDSLTIGLSRSENHRPIGRTILLPVLNKSIKAVETVEKLAA